MRSELENIELIDRYLLDELSQEERTEVEMRMETEPSFKEEVEFQREANDLLLMNDLYLLNDQVRNHKYKKIAKASNYYKYGLFLLGFAGIAILGYVLSNFDSELIEPKNEVVEHFNPEIDSTSKQDISKLDKPTKIQDVPSIPETVSNNELVVTEKQEIIFSTETCPEIISTKQNHEDTKQTKILSSVEIDTAKQNYKPDNVEISNQLDKNKTSDPQNEINNDEYQLDDQEIVDTSPESSSDTTSANSVSPVNKRPYNYDLAFSPSRGQTVAWPVSDKADKKIKVYNNYGEIIYQVDVQIFEEAEWDGVLLNGSMIEFGSYMLVIDYSDDSEPIMGSLTIVE